MADGCRDTAEIRVSLPLVQDFAYIAERMRPDEREQFVAFTGVERYDANMAARSYVLSGGLAYALIDRQDKPFAIGWFEELRPGVWEVTGIGTPDGWKRYWRAITKQSRMRMDDLIAGGAHRIQILALASRTDAHRWYERGLGMQREGVLRGYCANGDDAVIYARVRES